MCYEEVNNHIVLVSINEYVLYFVCVYVCVCVWVCVSVFMLGFLRLCYMIRPGTRFVPDYNGVEIASLELILTTPSPSLKNFAYNLIIYIYTPNLGL